MVYGSFSQAAYEGSIPFARSNTLDGISRAVLSVVLSDLFILWSPVS
jgi:hypothetical protein